MMPCVALRKVSTLGVQAAYWGMLEEGRITQTTAILLMQSVDEATDLVSEEPLSDWKGLKDNVHFPNYYKFLRTSFFPQKLVTSFTVERLELSCYICAAFLRAHRVARLQLHEFIGKDLPKAILESFNNRQFFDRLLLVPFSFWSHFYWFCNY